MSIIASEPFPAQLRPLSVTCPVWCAEHCDGDNGAVMHMTQTSSVAATAGGPGEFRQVHVECEQMDRDGHKEPGIVRLDDDTLLTADEALHLAGLLVLAARRVYTSR